MILCVLPVFVYADETASLKITTNLTTGTPNGIFKFTIKEVGTDTYIPDANGIEINTAESNFYTINNLKPNTEYLIEELTLPTAYDFVSIEIKDQNKIITNTQKINVTTGDADSITEVIATNTTNTSNGTGIANNKETSPIKDPVTGLPTGTSNLSLSVTGKANTTTTSTGANVLIIYDVSASMKDGVSYPYYQRYTGNPTNGLRLKGFQDGKYIDICYNSSAGEWRIYNKTSYTCTNERYTGDYPYELISGQNRAQHTEPIVRDFAQRLLEKGANLSLVIFNDGATERSGWTKSTDILNNFKSNGTSYNTGMYNSIGGINSSTNWELAYRQGYTTIGSLTAEQRKDPTYVVFITDGEPTSDGNISNDNPQGEYETINGQLVGLQYYKNTLDEVKNITGMTSQIYGIYAFGTVHNNLDDLIYYANSCYGGNCHERPASDHGGVTTDTVDTTNYYTAVDTIKLTEAIEDIFKKITTTIGFSNVSINDGTTSQIRVESEPLLGVKPNDSDPNKDIYTYWLSMPVEKEGSNYKLTRINKANGNNETIRFTQGGDNKHITATWGNRTFNLEGSITNIGTAEKPKYELKYKWDENAFYDFDTPTKKPPKAEYTDSGSIVWDLSSLNKLINDVTYTVDVEVWPTQYTQDLIADLMNHPEKYDELEEYIKNYIVRTKVEGTENQYVYTLKTNTKALITYTDSNDNNGTTKMNDPNPLATNLKEVSVTKKIINDVDPEDYKVDKVDLYLKSDNDILPDPITINKSNSWTENIFLAMGIIKKEKDSNNNIVANVVEKGHDYSFAENDYHWVLDVDKIMHPMLIDGVVTMLIKTDMNPSLIGNSNFIEQNGTTYYKICRDTCSVYEVKNDADSSKLLVTNTRKSNLNIKKQVLGDYTGTDRFEFTIKVKSTENLWFSIADESTTTTKPPIINMTGLVTGATLTPDSKTGDYYYEIKGVNASEWKEVTVLLQDGWNIRFTNVPKNTQFEVVESNIPGNGSIVFDNITINKNGTIDNSQHKVTTTIADNNKKYDILYQNRYLLTKIDVTKEWKDLNGNAVITNLPNSITVNIIPSKIIEDKNIKEQEVELNKDNNWTCSLDLPKYVWNETTKTYDEITYSVLETKINGKDLPSNKKFDVKDEFNAVIGRWILGDVSGTLTDSGMNYSITNNFKEANKKDLSIVKVRFGDNINDPELTGLSGAVFKLYRYLLDDESDDTILVNDTTPNWKLFATSDGSAKFNFNNLYAGVYRLVEITSPNGYVLPGGQWKIVVTENEDGTVTIGNPTKIKTPTAITKINDTFYVYNEQLPEIPSTGARGIIDYSLIGLILMTLASFILIVNQKEKI